MRGCTSDAPTVTRRSRIWTFPTYVLRSRYFLDAPSRVDSLSVLAARQYVTARAAGTRAKPEASPIRTAGEASQSRRAAGGSSHGPDDDGAPTLDTIKP